MAKLRSEGWSVPTTIADDVVVRVYDTRLNRTWLQGVLRDLQLEVTDKVLVGGDFLFPPDKEDHLALQAGRLDRWGPSGDTPYHIVVPPRHHLEKWIQRARQQVAIEAVGSWITMGCVVPPCGMRHHYAVYCPKQLLCWQIPVWRCALLL